MEPLCPSSSPQAESILAELLSCKHEPLLMKNKGRCGENSKWIAGQSQKTKRMLKGGRIPESTGKNKGRATSREQNLGLMKVCSWHQRHRTSTMCPAGFLKFLDSVPFLAAWQLTARTYMCELAAMRTVHMCQLKLQPQNLKLNKLFKNYQVVYHTQHKLTQIIKCKGYPEWIISQILSHNIKWTFIFIIVTQSSSCYTQTIIIQI